MNINSLATEREHLANLLEAVQRCAHVVHASSSKVTLLHEDLGRYTASAYLASR